MDEEGGSFIPPTENAQRIARRERCACGEMIELPIDASEKAIETAVIRHQKTNRHATWWKHMEASQ